MSLARALILATGKPGESPDAPLREMGAAFDALAGVLESLSGAPLPAPLAPEMPAPLDAARPTPERRRQ